jgi:uncharacterized membrane-anchored protein
MNSPRNGMPLESMLDALESHRYIEAADRDSLETFADERRSEPEPPLYLRIIVGVGSFIAALCFVGFLASASVIDFDSAGTLIFWGIPLVGCALLILGSIRDVRGALGNAFAVQSSFALMSTGKILFVSGLGLWFRDPWAVTAGTTVITAVTYFPYRMAIDRYLSTSALFLSVLLNLVFEERYAPGLLEVYLLLLTIGAGITFTHGRVDRAWIPAAYGILTTLCAAVLLSALPGTMGALFGHGRLSTVYLGWLFAGCAVPLFGWASGDIRRLKEEPLAIAALGAVLLGAVSAPGVLLAICLFVLGYARHERMLTVLATVFLPVFLAVYYRNLEATLFQKSLILVCSGLVLLAGRLYLRLHVEHRYVEPPSTAPRSRPTLAMLLSSAVVFAAFNVSILSHEGTIRNGETILLKLAPVDPRSLMQGDYMRLRYTVENEADRSATPGASSVGTFVVLRVDSNRVGTFVRFDDGSPLATDERKFLVRRRSGRTVVRPDSFMFQEGHAAAFAAARYGIFKVDRRGTHLLVGLANDELRAIEPDA